MKVGLFIPCYIDQFYPNVGVATLQLLEKLGCDVSLPLNQTCCGQPMAYRRRCELFNAPRKNFEKATQ
jgi:L-lactate dehydrogenase complex protein LldE